MTKRRYKQGTGSNHVVATAPQRFKNRLPTACLHSRLPTRSYTPRYQTFFAQRLSPPCAFLPKHHDA